MSLLPRLGHQELYNKFKQDEAWDSPDNKKLLKEMPLVYQCPDRPKAEPFTTTYRVFTGNGALFERERDIGVADVIDGTSNTIAVVESKEAVPWTKPDDLPFDRQVLPRSLVPAHPTRGASMRRWPTERSDSSRERST